MSGLYLKWGVCYTVNGTQRKPAVLFRTFFKALCYAIWCRFQGSRKVEIFLIKDPML